MNPTFDDLRVFLRSMDMDPLHSLIRLEIKQREEEGFDVAGFRVSLKQLNSTEKLADLYHELLDAPRSREFSYSEPETLSGIRAVRPAGPRRIELNLKLDTLFDRIYGGWLGRVCGCALGKPVEPFGYRGKIIDYLKLANSYPLANYIPRLNPLPVDYSFAPSRVGLFLGEIDGALDDDDTDYTILALHILETYGLDFKTEDVAAEWLGHLAYLKTYTAERAAYRNLVLGISPAASAQFFNPEREYIGARIRADSYGMVAPGNPEMAAELAYRDASLSHAKNGVYSAMFMAACVAWSFVTDDIEEIMRVGLSEIPENCRQAEAIHEVLGIYQEVDDWENAYERLLEKCASYHPVHAINNTVWMVLALLYGKGNFEKTICMATMCGFDTDCNAANAGTIMGVLSGAQALPHKWTAPLKDTVRSAVSQFAELRISDLARRTAAVAEIGLSKFSN